LRDLVHINEPLEKKDLRVKKDISEDSAKFDAKIDLRGLRLPDAVKALEVFVDKAFLNNSNVLQILHGKGDGVLRRAVKQKIKEYKGIKQISHPAPEFGGDGITNVELV
jgi:DNA mismatch repair protein MutS2